MSHAHLGRITKRIDSNRTPQARANALALRTVPRRDTTNPAPVDFAQLEAELHAERVSA